MQLSPLKILLEEVKDLMRKVAKSLDRLWRPELGILQKKTPRKPRRRACVKLIIFGLKIKRKQDLQKRKASIQAELTLPPKERPWSIVRGAAD